MATYKEIIKKLVKAGHTDLAKALSAYEARAGGLAMLELRKVPDVKAAYALGLKKGKEHGKSPNVPDSRFADQQEYRKEISQMVNKALRSLQQFGGISTKNLQTELDTLSMLSKKFWYETGWLEAFQKERGL